MGSQKWVWYGFWTWTAHSVGVDTALHKYLSSRAVQPWPWWLSSSSLWYGLNETISIKSTTQNIAQYEEINGARADVQMEVWGLLDLRFWNQTSCGTVSKYNRHHWLLFLQTNFPSFFLNDANIYIVLFQRQSALGETVSVPGSRVGSDWSKLIVWSPFP